MNTRATLHGAAAILLWSTLSALTAATGRIPPFELTALTFLIGGLLGTAVVVMRGETPKLVQPIRIWLGGIGGLFGYHALYFAALRLAPPAEAGLVNYLWPLLIVVFSALLPGMHVTPRHLVGAALGFAGLVAMAQGRIAGSIADVSQASDTFGYLLALLAALVWAGYSVWSRATSSVPSAAVAGFCLGTSATAAVVHFLVEETIIPQTAVQWAAIVTLGLGPVGLAFFLWDDGMKRGDLRLLAILSYATPVLSTGLLVICGMASPTLSLAVACLMIAAGGAVASSQKKKPA